MPNDHLLQMRVSKDFLATLDKWRSAQRPIPARAEAIRQLVLAALKTKTRAS